MKKVLRFFFRWLAWSILFLLFLFSGVWIALQFPGVQTYVVQKLTDQLAHSLNTKASVGHVNIKFFKTLALKDIYIEDQKQDTLLYANNLEVSIGLFSLFQRKIFLDQILLENTDLKLKRTESDSRFNFAFILNAFAANPEKPPSPSQWVFDVNQVKINNLNFNFDDIPGGLSILAKLEEFSAQLENLDLKNQRLDVGDLQLHNSTLAIAQGNAFVPKTKTEENVEISFPFTGWQFSCRDLLLKDNQIGIQNLPASQQNKPGVNFQDLAILNLGLNVRDFVWEESLMEAKLNGLHFKEKSGFEVVDLTTDFYLGTTQIQLNELYLKTPYTSIKNSTTLSYSRFSDLQNWQQATRVQSKFAPTQIDFRDLALLAPAIGNLPYLHLPATKSLGLSGQIDGNLSNLQATNINLRIGQELELKTNLTLQNLLNKDSLRFAVNLQQLSSSYDQLMKVTRNLNLPIGLQQFGRFSLTGKAMGTLADFTTTDLSLTTAAKTAFKLSGRFQGLPDPSQLAMDINIESLQTQADDLRGFATNGLPTQLDSLGLILYKGEFKGTLHQFELIGLLSTAIGDLSSDLKMDFTNDYQNASYGGALQFEMFNLGKFLANESKIGTVSLMAFGEGRGLRLDSLTADAKININSFTYLNYTYDSIKVDGQFDRRQFTGTLQMQDKNADLNFVGAVNLNDSIPDFKFALKIDTINFDALNLYPSPLGLSTQLYMNLSGKTINSINGQVEVLDLNLTDDSLHFHSDTLRIFADQAKKMERQIAISSNFFIANIDGSYDLDELPTLFRSYLNEYFPTDTLISGNTETSLSQISQAQKFKLSFKIIDPAPFSMLFLPQLTRLDYAEINGTFDSEKRSLQLDGQIDQMQFAGTGSKMITLAGKGNPGTLTLKIEANEFFAGNQLNFPVVQLTTQLLNDSLYTQLAVTGDSLARQLAIGGVLTRPDSFYSFSFSPDFILNNESWRIASGNQIVFSPDELHIKNLDLSIKQQRISINSIENIDSQLIPSIKILFQHFQIKEVSELASLEDSYLEGELNGTVELFDIRDNLHYNVSLNVPNLALNKAPVGALVLEANQLSDRQTISLFAELTGPEDELRAQGTYEIDTRKINLQADISRLEMRLLDPFLASVISKSQGRLSGTFLLQGTTEAPEYSGKINLVDVSTLVAFTNTRYQLKQGEILLNKSSIDLGTIELIDKDNHKAVVRGKIKHNNFSNLQFALQLQTDEFLFLNTKVTDNELFYGKLLLKANVNLSGPVATPLVEITAQTLPSSEFNLSPFITSEAIIEEDYIIFGNPNTFKEEDSKQVEYQIKNNFPADIRINLQLTDATTFRFMVDPESGDNLTCLGNANLQVNLKPSGAIEMFGNYVISSGSYDFSYGEVVKRKFAIQKGGMVIFNGDPLNARFNVTAIYETNTTTYELISNETTLSSAEIQQAKRRQRIDVLLRLQGELSSPVITFDLIIPDEQNNSLITSAIDRKFAELRANPNEMNKQVFGLLLVNSFIASESTTPSFTDVGQGVLLSSVSKLFTNELNKLADKLVKGVDINIDVNSYKSQYINEGAGGTVTEVGVGISKQLFNERLSLTAGGNFDVNTGGTTNSNFSTIAGDFLLEYKLTENGNYVLRVFRRSDYDILDEANSAKNGVSISFKKNFSSRKIQKPKVKSQKEQQDEK